MPKKTKATLIIDEKSLNEVVKQATHNHLQGTSAGDAECPNPVCKRSFAVTFGQNACPFCRSNVAVTPEFN